MTNHDIVKKLIGEIRPVGETNADNERFKNLEAMAALIEHLLYDVDDMANDFKNRGEYSIKRSSDFAARFIKRISNSWR